MTLGAVLVLIGAVALLTLPGAWSLAGWLFVLAGLVPILDEITPAPPLRRGRRRRT